MRPNKLSKIIHFNLSLNENFSILIKITMLINLEDELTKYFNKKIKVEYKVR